MRIRRQGAHPWVGGALLAVAVAVVVSSGSFPGYSRGSQGGNPGASAPGSGGGPTASPDCAKLHPADLIPGRAAERDWNFYCSSQFRPPGAGGAGPFGPDGFGIYNLATTYDSYDGYSLLLGATGNGTNNGTQTWSYVNDTWTRLAPASSPESCAGSSLTYDDTDQYVVYLGGANVSPGSNCTSAGQTWTYRGGAWTELSPSVSPPARLGAALTNDSGDGYVLLFGGLNATGVPLNDTWSFSGGAWTQLFPSAAPSARSGEGMAYDAFDGYVLLFGGSSFRTCTDQQQDDLFCMDRDTWTFHAGTWTQLSPVGAVPPEPYDDGLVYDAAAHDVLYTVTDDNFSSDPEIWWTFQGGNWTDPYGNAGTFGANQSLPANRFGEALAYDYRDGYDLMYGGTGISWAWLNDTWDYANGAWTELSPGSQGGLPVYAVTFTASGLPASTPWSIRFNGTTATGNVSTLQFSVPNGTYNFSALPVAGFEQVPANGQVTVAGDPISVGITFTPTVPTRDYNVTFVERGLPDGTVWTVLFAGGSYHGYSVITIAEPNGSYPWSIVPISGQTATLTPQPIVVAGAPVTAYLNFTRSSGPPTYLVAFLEYGLPLGATWFVQLDSSIASSSGTTVQFSVPVGNHTFEVTAPSGYQASPATGQVDVLGAVEVDVAFSRAPASPVYTLNVSEQGLPAGTYWSISISSVGYSALEAWITTNLSNGSYQYQPGTLDGYAASPSDGEITIAGAPAVLEITYSAIAFCCPPIPPPQNGNLSFYEGLGLGIVGGILLGVGIMGAAVWIGRRVTPPSTGR